MAKRPAYKKRFSLLQKFYREQEAKRYWKQKYFSCKHDLESLQGFKRR